MPKAKLRALAMAGRTLDEIATINEAETGWRPTRSTVSKRLKEENMLPRHVYRTDLIPWRIRPEHSNHRYRNMLEAEARRRALPPGKELTRNDKHAIDMLEHLLIGRGVPLVVGYLPEIGWYLADRTDADKDIIRMPADRSNLRVVQRSE